MSEQTNDTTKFFRIRGVEPNTWQCLKCESNFYGPVAYTPDATIALTHCPKCGRRITHVDGREVLIESFLPEDCSSLPIVGGKLVKPGDRLWEQDSGKEWPVVEVTLYADNYCICAESPRGDNMRAYGVSKFTRVKPVLDHDGVKINVGDTLYDLNDDEGAPLEVVDVNSDSSFSVGFRDKSGVYYRREGNQLSHELPDTWERIENDVDVNCCTYFKWDGACEDCQVPATESDCDLYKVHDLIRRAKALAGVVGDE